MKIVIIGGTGHIGTYLVPRLMDGGHEVVSVSRRRRSPYQPHTAWKELTQINIDREAAENEGNFGDLIRQLEADVVVDLICFTPESARQLVESLDGQIRLFLHCGTMWVHGYSEQVPTVESQPRKPLCDYGIKKTAIETYLLSLARKKGFPATVLHPGHIVGKGWVPVNPAGNFNKQVYNNLSEGKEVLLPNMGLETLHHVHADDVAQAFVRAIENSNNAMGESFHVVSPQAVTLRGYAEAMAQWFGQPPRLRFLAWDEWRQTVNEQDADATWDHVSHSPVGSIDKARRLIGYHPRYSSLQAVQESVQYLIENNMI